MISFEVSGSFKQMEASLRNMLKVDVPAIMATYAKQGVSALANATPVDSSLASHSWGYTIEAKNGKYTLTFTNKDVEDGYPVVIMIQYGHGTGTGGYVQGIDFINPAIRPIFRQIADKVWKAVTSA